MNLEFEHNLKLKAETKDPKAKKHSKLITFAIIIAISLTVVLSVGVWIKVEYTWSNTPQVERKAEK